MNALRVWIPLVAFVVAVARAENTNNLPTGSVTGNTIPSSASNTAASTSLTIDGVTYQDVRWGRLTPATVTIYHKTGIAAIPLEKLPPELQKRFGYDPKKASEYRAAEVARVEALRAEEEEKRGGFSGDFVFSATSVESTGIEVFFRGGSIVNKTNRDWNRATFQVVGFDSAGRKLPFASSGFTINQFRKGEARLTGEFSALYYNPRDTGQIEVARWVVEFVEGEIEPHYSFRMVKPKESGELAFSDDAVSVAFSIPRQQCAFTIHNKTPNPVKVDWNQVSYVDVLNQSHKVIHEGTKYTEKGQSQPITVVPPGASVTDTIIPVDSVRFVTGSGNAPGEWEVDPLFPAGKGAKLWKGRTFGVFMPLEMNGAVTNYYFAFEITGVDF
ncbi:MAG: hypothetical protein ABSH21_12955 [Verrucomicrobiia bacterium]|jgi:hypothetical protein